MTDEELIEGLYKIKAWAEVAGDVDFWETANNTIRLLEQQPCEDCISREAVKRILADQRDELVKLHTVNPEDNPKADAMAYGVNWSLNTLMELPSVTPTRPKGKWKPLNYKDEMWGYVYKCSNCGAIEYGDNYCPNCGAKMEVEE